MNKNKLKILLIDILASLAELFMCALAVFTTMMFFIIMCLIIVSFTKEMFNIVNVKFEPVYVLCAIVLFGIVEMSTKSKVK